MWVIMVAADEDISTKMSRKMSRRMKIYEDVDQERDCQKDTEPESQICMKCDPDRIIGYIGKGKFVLR